MCSCTLDYFFVTCRIQLAGWINKQVSLSNEEILEPSPQTLMDYGIVSSVLFNDPNQINNFGKQLASAILKEFEYGAPRVKARICSIPPVWGDYDIIPTIHRIRVESSIDHFLLEYPIMRSEIIQMVNILYQMMILQM